MIYITSFFKIKELPLECADNIWSAAVYQPGGFNLPKATCWEIKDAEGKWIRPRNFIKHKEPLQDYRQAMWDLYSSRHEEIKSFHAQVGQPMALLCWCPYDKAAKRQLEEFGSFVCHTAVIGEYLTEKLGVSVWYDSDRLKLAVLGQKYNGGAPSNANACTAMNQEHYCLQLSEHDLHRCVRCDFDWKD